MIRTPRLRVSRGRSSGFTNLGHNLGAAAHLARAVFDVQLGRVRVINAAQAVALMVLACERTPHVSSCVATSVSDQRSSPR